MCLRSLFVLVKSHLRFGIYIRAFGRTDAATHRAQRSYIFTDVNTVPMICGKKAEVF